MYTSYEFDSVKKALFGNQVQANVFNEATVSIVLQYIKKVSTVTLTTSDEAVDVIKDVLRSLLHKEQITLEDEVFTRLVAGNISYNNLLSSEPRLLNVRRSSADSPKHLFRIEIFGMPCSSEDNGDMDNIIFYDQPDSSGVKSGEEQNSYTALADKIYGEVQGIIPETIQEKVKDKYVQAMITLYYMCKNKGVNV